MKPDSYYKSGEDLSFKNVSHEEERRLFMNAKAGDLEAKEVLIRSHLLFVSNLARRLAKGRLPEEDVISAANFALVKAFENFDPAYPNRFAAFLKLFVRGEVARLWASLNIVRKSDFSDGTSVTSVEMSDDVYVEEDADEKNHNEFLLKLVEQAKLVLDPREREIVGLLYCEVPASQADVARQLKLSRERVRQLFDGALHKLQKQLRILMNENGIE